MRGVWKELEREQGAQDTVAERAGLLDEDQMARAMQRQVGASQADWSHDEEDGDDEEIVIEVRYLS